MNNKTRDMGLGLLMIVQGVLIAVLGAWDGAAYRRIDDLQMRLDQVQLEMEVLRPRIVDGLDNGVGSGDD